MQVAVIGAGRIGGNIARQLARAGHQITVAFSRDPQKLQALADEIGARAAAPASAVTDAEVVVVSVPWGALPDALERLGSLEGGIVIDTTT
jgi:predicted dinucleotide-binding enzyme